jgi:hypothetical protein
MIEWDPDAAGPLPTMLVLGGRFANGSNIVGWDGQTQRTFGSGFDMIWGHDVVRALAVYQGELIAAGHFTSSGGIALNSIARWDGSEWQSLGGGTDGIISTLTHFGGELVAGGSFTVAGGSVAQSIARWNGAIWQPLGSGVSGGQVQAASPHVDKLVIGGSFSHAGGVQANRTAVWNGAQWTAAGSGLSATVRIMTPFQGWVAASGDFLISDGFDISNIALWNGIDWAPAVSGTNGAVISLLARVDQLFAGGSFSQAGGGNGASGIARWYGQPWPFDWEALDPELPNPQFATSLAWHNFDLHVASALRLRRFVEPSAPPSITSQPQAQVVPEGAAATLRVVATGTSGLFYQWRRNGSPLANGGSISGALRSTLVISPVLASDGGQYSCAITSACGDLLSDSVALTITPACGSPDFDGDGDTATDADIEAFFACLAGNCCPACGSADFDGDGDTATDADIEAFFRVLAGGTC